MYRIYTIWLLNWAQSGTLYWMQTCYLPPLYILTVISAGVYCRSSPPPLALVADYDSCKWSYFPVTDQDIYVKSCYTLLMFLYNVINIFQCWQSLFDVFFDLYFPFELFLMTRRTFEKPISRWTRLLFQHRETSNILRPVKAVMTLKSDVLYWIFANPKLHWNSKIFSKKKDCNTPALILCYCTFFFFD